MALRWLGTVRRRCAGPRGSAAGFTLAELLVALLLFGMIGAMLATITVEALATERRQSSTATSLSTLTIQLERIAAQIREANPLLVAGPEALTLQIPQGAAGSLTLSYSVGTGLDGHPALLLNQTQTSAAGTTTTLPQAVVVPDVVVPSNGAIFTYTGAAGVALTPISGSDPASYDPSAVVTVGMTLQEVVPDSSSVLSVSDTVEVRNAT